MDTLRRSVRRVRDAARRKSSIPESDICDEYQEGLNEFQVNTRRRESIRVKKLCGGRAGLEKEIRKKICLEESLCLGSAKLIYASKSESQILEASKNLMLGCTRLESLKTELGKIARTDWSKPARSRLAEVSLSDLRIPLAWKHRDNLTDMGDNKKFAVFCIVRSGTQVYDTGLVIIDRTVADLSFSDIFAFSNLSPEFDIKVEVYSHLVNAGLLGTPKNWIRKFKSMIVTNQKSRPLDKVATFDMLAEIKLTVDDANDAIVCHNLDKTANMTVVKEEQMPQLFGQICCRLAVSPYCNQEPIVSGFMAISWPESEIVIPGCFGQLLNWRLEIWSSLAHYRRGEQPWKVLRIDSMSLVREMGTKFCVENEREEHVDIICDQVDDIRSWVSEILSHIEDYSKWNKAATDEMEVLSPNVKKEMGGKKLRQKTKSRLMMLYDRISSSDLQDMNLDRNNRIVRRMSTRL